MRPSSMESSTDNSDDFSYHILCSLIHAVSTRQAIRSELYLSSQAVPRRLSMLTWATVGSRSIMVLLHARTTCIRSLLSLRRFVDIFVLPSMLRVSCSIMTKGRSIPLAVRLLRYGPAARGDHITTCILPLVSCMTVSSCTGDSLCVPVDGLTLHTKDHNMTHHTLKPNWCNRLRLEAKFLEVFMG